MFRDFKSGGYNLEDTKVSGERLVSVILLIAIAYTSATIFGQKIKDKGVQKYVDRVKEYGRTERRHSSFYIGLYGESALREGFPPQATAIARCGQTWVYFMEQSKDLVTELMKLSRKKCQYYQRGLRAMELILAAF